MHLIVQKSSLFNSLFYCCVSVVAAAWFGLSKLGLFVSLTAFIAFDFIVCSVSHCSSSSSNF